MICICMMEILAREWYSMSEQDLKLLFGESDRLVAYHKGYDLEHFVKLVWDAYQRRNMYKPYQPVLDKLFEKLDRAGYANRQCFS